MLDSWSHHLSPSPSVGSSTRSSHLSVFSNASSAPSPPPSPTGLKTFAFFASPFSDHPSLPSPPPNPHRKASSESADNTEVSSDDTPRLPHNIPRSLNAEFFGPSLLPTPPPSIRSLSSTRTREVSQPASPSLSRDNSTSPPPIASPSHPSPASSRFVHIDSQNAPASSLDTSYAHPTPHAGEQTESPTDLQLSAPGFARDDRGTRRSPQSPRLQLTPQPTALPDDPAFASPRGPPSPPPSESEHLSDAKLEPGLTVASSSLALELVKPLGEGSFSSVWLARDAAGQLNALELSRKSSLARIRSLRGRKSRTIDGTRPTRKTEKTGDGGARSVLSPDGELPPKLRVARQPTGGRLVAVKMTERAKCDTSSRSRVSFVREVEVLRHIAHPSIVSYLHSFSTPSHHCLVLECVGGGELLDLVDNPVVQARSPSRSSGGYGESCAEQWRGCTVWVSCIATSSWKHPLDDNPLADPLPSQSLIKLTDFGLSRFIDPANPQLTTLCGSDSRTPGRAASSSTLSHAPPPVRLPVASERTADGREADWAVQQRRRADRKALLNRIAQGDYRWPEEPLAAADPARLRGTELAQSDGIRRAVGRLLVRDPRRRARVADLWTDAWMHGEGRRLRPCWRPRKLGVDPEDADVDMDDGEGVLVDGEDIGPGSVARQEH
ncbi:uncharacterized protein BXZ73DRAFT_105226 [Epithele typhae]|uniref:uncharacterized protein n=1 Tax=Epithele typhae TaxID=378194 RepID=UPI002007DC47|nr:uncharacterized protein BXZ73DRAFT_105226 [Epithele typhae]KAH9918344.1 hypothetical protein BXZ73DRAFT_105226 [Epithele typhae]